MPATHVRYRMPLVASLILLFALWLVSSQAANALVEDRHQWQVVPSATPGTVAALYGASALATGGAWAVGNYEGKTLTERWDGSRFKVVPSPGIPNIPNYLRGVSAISTRDVWAVGDSGTGQGTKTLTEHWNGTKWKIVSSPSPGLFNYLNAVVAVSANNVWAVGRWDTPQGAYSTLIEHWDGNSWHVVPSPNVTGYNELNAVTAVSANNIWAVGYYLTFRADGAAINQTLTEHWNGRYWQVVSSPNVANLSNTFLGVTAVSSSNIWAVGGIHNPTASNGSVLIEHWNGSQWKIITSPAIPSGGGLNGVAAVSSHDIWSVGSYGPLAQTLIEHWNGSQWKIIASPNPGTSNILWAVAADKTGRALAVGAYSVNAGPDRTLAMVHDV